MKIGITERGDAARDLSWTNTLNSYDGAILITKTITTDFAHAVLNAKKPLIVHCTCTGYGGTELEPNVFDYKTQLNSMKHLIDAGFSKHNVVLRIDPIFPTQKGLRNAANVLEYFLTLNTGVTRVRFSIVDEYRHVRERFAAKGWGPVYQNGKPSQAQLDGVLQLLETYHRDHLFFESCAEHMLAQRAEELGKRYLFEEVGCISREDLFLMGFENIQKFGINPQQRTGCRCLSCKSEMLSNKKPCPNGCIYCYWRG